MQDYRKAVQWLLGSNDPSIRYLSMVDLLGAEAESKEVLECRKLIPTGPKVKSLLAGQQGDGGFGVDPYRKWIGSHWRLVSMVNLAISPDNSNALRASDQVLKWLYGIGRRRQTRNDSGYTRMHASVEGNAVGVFAYLGRSEDPRVEYLLRLILDAQWPDGGWNCDGDPKATHSSFHESLSTLWGLIMYNKVARSGDVGRAIERACEFFLNHRIIFSHTTGRLLKQEWLKLRYPVYWHYNFLEAMRILSLASKGKDPRMNEALDLLESKCGISGLWGAEGFYWRHLAGEALQHPGARTHLDAVDWGRTGPNEIITLNALRVLKAAGRLRV